MVYVIHGTNYDKEKQLFVNMLAFVFFVSDRTLDLSNGTLIKYSSSKSGLLPGTPIFQDDSKVFGLIQEKCDKGWGTSKSKCGIRLNREVFNFICQETKDSVAGCTDTLLQRGK